MLSSKRQKTWILKEVISLSILAIVGIFFIFFFRTAVVSGYSMSPTYVDGDFVVILRHLPIHNGDVVGVYSDKLKEDLCKRVIAQSGDTISGTVQGICVNGTVLEESYLGSHDFVYIFEEQVIPEGMCYVLGDNRDNSTDSREIGLLSEDDITGRVVLNCTKTFGLTYETFRIALFPLWAILLLSLGLTSNPKRSVKHIL